MSKYTDFYNMVLNHGYDKDGYYGWQCWDGYAEYCEYLGVPYAHCTRHGYACDIWEERATNGMLKYFDEVSVMQQGDIAVFRKVAGVTPYSHICIFHSDIDGTYGYFLGQNQGSTITNPNGGSAFNVVKLPYSATFDTAFRLKSSSSTNTSTSSDFDTSQLIEEQGKATFTVDNVNARVNGPSGTVCRQYMCGDVVNYDYKWIGNGHRYIAWYEASNLILVAVSGSEEYGKDKWAECTARDTSSNTDGGNSGSDTNDDTDDIEQPNLTDEVLDTTDINLKVSLVDKSNYAYKCPYVMEKPKYIIIHNAGTNGDPSAEQLNKSMNNKEYKSWHFSVDESGAVEGLPLNRNNFSCGDGANGDGNRNGIAIEICRDMSSADDVTNRAEANGALLAAILLKKYGLSVKDGLKKHQDFKMTDGTYKYCPHRILDNGWDDFVAKVESYYNGSDDSDNGSDSDEKVNVGLINQLLELLISILKRIFGK